MPLIVEQSATLLAHTPNPEQLIERCGRVCYKSEDKITTGSAAQLIKRILKSGHESVIEHASATLLLVTDRGVTHELVRHRIGVAYSQESTRYCRYGGGIQVIQPPGVSYAWRTAMRYTEEAYLDMLANGAKPQIARSVLPNSLKTEIAVTMNFRAWRHFFSLRMAKPAHPQIRQLACKAWEILVELAPTCFEEFRPLAEQIEKAQLV